MCTGSCSTASGRSVASVSTWSRGSDARNEHDLKTNRLQEYTVHMTAGLDEHPDRKGDWNRHGQRSNGCRRARAQLQSSLEAEAQLAKHGRACAQADHQSKRTTWMRNQRT